MKFESGLDFYNNNNSFAKRRRFDYSNPMNKIFAHLPELLIVLFFMLIIAPLNAVNYDEGDWVGYNDFRYVTSIAADQNVVYFGTTGGVIRYDRYSKNWLTPLTMLNGLPSNYVRAIAFDRQYNELWIETDRGTGRYNITFGSWYNDINYPGNLEINNWNPNRFSTLFMPFEYDYSGGYVSDPNMQRYLITVGFEDNFTYQMYVGTWGMGAAIINTEHLEFKPINFGPYGQNISRVIKIGDALWMGTDIISGEQAVTQYNLRTKQWQYYKSESLIGLDNTEVIAAINFKNNLWLGTSSGLLRIENERNLNTYRGLSHLPSLDILSLAEYGKYLYVGTDNGMTILPITGEIPDSLFKMPLPEEYLLRGQQINDLYVFKDVLYIATDRRLYSYNAGAGQFRELDTPRSDLAWGSNDIFADGTNLYIATRSGVVMINPETDTSYVATEHKFSNSWIIYQVYADKNYIWAATDVGLWKYRKKDRFTYLYTVADGLPVNEVNSLAADGDYLWLGTRKGLIRFYWNDPGRGD